MTPSSTLTEALDRVAKIVVDVLDRTDLNATRPDAEQSHWIHAASDERGGR